MSTEPTNPSPEELRALATAHREAVEELEQRAALAVTGIALDWLRAHRLLLPPADGELATRLLAQSETLKIELVFSQLKGDATRPPVTIRATVDDPDDDERRLILADAVLPAQP